MNVRQRRAIVDARIMVVAQEQVAIIFAAPRADQPAAIEAAIDAVQDEPIEVVRGCVRVFDSISEQIATFS